MEVEVDGTIIDPLCNLIRNIRKRPQEIPFFLQNLITTPFTFLKCLVVELMELVRNSLF